MPALETCKQSRHRDARVEPRMTAFVSTKTKRGAGLDAATPRLVERDALDEAAGGDDAFAGQPAGLIGGEEDGDLADVVRLADAAERRLAATSCFSISLPITPSVWVPSVSTPPGADRVDADFARAELARRARVTESSAPLVPV